VGLDLELTIRPGALLRSTMALEPFRGGLGLVPGPNLWSSDLWTCFPSVPRRRHGLVAVLARRRDRLFPLGFWRTVLPWFRLPSTSSLNNHDRNTFIRNRNVFNTNIRNVNL